MVGVPDQMAHVLELLCAFFLCRRLLEFPSFFSLLLLLVVSRLFFFFCTWCREKMLLWFVVVVSHFVPIDKKTSRWCCWRIFAIGTKVKIEIFNGIKIKMENFSCYGREGMLNCFKFKAFTFSENENYFLEMEKNYFRFYLKLMRNSRKIIKESTNLTHMFNELQRKSIIYLRWKFDFNGFKFKKDSMLFWLFINSIFMILVYYIEYWKRL